MSESFDFGKKAEEAAEKYLINKGYRILTTNYRAGKAEVDLFAAKDDLIICVEVKARSSKDFAAPEEAVNKTKIKHLVQAANQFLENNTQFQEVRFDIISISGKESHWKITHLEDAFQPWDAN